METWDAKFGITRQVINIMWNILEQYGFIRTAISFNDERIQQATFWSVVANILIMTTGWFDYWANDVLGMSVGVTLMIFIILFFDLITGMCASVNEGQTLSSKRGLRWVFKFCSYIIFVYTLNNLVREVKLYEFGWLLYPMNIIKLFVIFTISFWEIKSIDENFERLGYSFGIFKLLNPIYNIFKGIVKKQSDVDIDKKDEPQL